jgi:UDP-glucose 4-epimerase
MVKVLVTGAAGFVGKALCAELLAQNVAVNAVVRTLSADLPASVQTVIADRLDGCTYWQEALQSVDVVVHLAARAHVMRDKVADPLAAFRQANVDTTLNLAWQAARADVKRFMFVSSIKVNGEVSVSGKPFAADDEPNPLDAYAISKLEAEVGLRHLALETGMEVVIIRPPLVYGVGVRANFLTMMRYLHNGVFLPFGAIANRRSFIALDNLVDVIMLCLTHPAAADQTFLVSDGEDMSTTELLQRLALALGKNAQLLPVPVTCLRYGLFLLGKGALAQRLCGNLQVDISKTRKLLSWTPPISVDDALYQTAQDFLMSR